MAQPLEHPLLPDARVLVVDDSASVRATMLSLLKNVMAENQISFAVDGRHALQQASRAALSQHPFDLVLLDIEMPLMDGLQALDELIKLRPAPKVIMSSALTRRGAAASMQALSRGACDYICKPTSSSVDCSEDFRNQLFQKVGFWINGDKKPNPVTPPPTTTKAPSATNSRIQPRHIQQLPRIPASQSRTPPVKIAAASSPAPEPALHHEPKATTKPTIAPKFQPAANSHSQRCRALAIGSSTGGPQALLSILSHQQLRALPFPIFITQHMPPTFTTILAEQIAKASGIACREAIEGEEVEPGRIYLAPGTHHMLLSKQGTKTIVSLSLSPPVNFCRPAVDPMLESLASIYGSGLRILILTGMGQDGLLGCQKARQQGAKVYAQDEQSSVVWGMPGAITKAGIADQVIELQKMPDLIKSL